MDWDVYYLKIAKTVAENSKCFSRKIGAVLVRENRIIATGYNGPPCSVRPCDQWAEDESWFAINTTKNPGICPRRTLGYSSGEGLHICPAAHAERNALISAARMGVAVNGSTLYCYCVQVCKDCAIEIINAGVKRIVFLEGTPYDIMADPLLKEAGIKQTRIPIALID